MLQILQVRIVIALKGLNQSEFRACRRQQIGQQFELPRLITQLIDYHRGGLFGEDLAQGVLGVGDQVTEGVLEKLLVWPKVARAAQGLSRKHLNLSITATLDEFFDVKVVSIRFQLRRLLFIMSFAELTSKFTPLPLLIRGIQVLKRRWLHPRHLSTTHGPQLLPENHMTPCHTRLNSLARLDPLDPCENPLPDFSHQVPLMRLIRVLLDDCGR